jgi:hypothetical protein
MAELPSLAPGTSPDHVYGNSSDGDLQARKVKMADLTGVKIIDLTAAGSSDDGEHVWITHRLGDGSEYPLVYPYEAVGYLITVLTDAARSASRRRSLQNPAEASRERAAAEAIHLPRSRRTTGPLAVRVQFSRSVVVLP